MLPVVWSWNGVKRLEGSVRPSTENQAFAETDSYIISSRKSDIGAKISKVNNSVRSSLIN